jgi:putative transposase
MKSAVKIRLDIDSQTQAALDGQAKIANWLYNHLLQHANELRSKYIETQSEEIARTLYTQRGLRDLIPDLKKKFPFLHSVYSSVLKNAALRLSDAIQEYQKSKKNIRKKKVNWPKFRSIKRKWFSLLYEEPWKGYSLKNGKIVLSLGKDANGKQIRLELQLAESFPKWYHADNVCQLRIVKEAGVYYAIFVVEREIPEPQSKKEKVVAIDPNHKNLGYGTDTQGLATEIQNPYFLKNIDKQIDAIKARKGRCKRKSIEIVRPDGSRYWRASRRWNFFNRKLEKLYQKRRDQIKTYLYTIANRLCKEYDVSAVGDYVPNGSGITRKMRRAMNNQSVIGNFKQILSWVALRSGRFFLQWAEKGSTRTCHECGFIVEGGIEPSVRKWECPKCHCFHIRDENASQNGLRKVLQELGVFVDHCNVKLRRFWKFDGQGIQEIPIQNLNT